MVIRIRCLLIHAVCHYHKKSQLSQHPRAVKHVRGKYVSESSGRFCRFSWNNFPVPRSEWCSEFTQTTYWNTQLLPSFCHWNEQTCSKTSRKTAPTPVLALKIKLQRIWAKAGEIALRTTALRTKLGIAKTKKEEEHLNSSATKAMFSKWHKPARDPAQPWTAVDPSFAAGQ